MGSIVACHVVDGVPVRLSTKASTAQIVVVLMAIQKGSNDDLLYASLPLAPDRHYCTAKRVNQDEGNKALQGWVFFRECRFASQPTFLHCEVLRCAWNMQEVMTSLLHVDLEVARSIRLFASDVGKPAVNGQQPASTRESQVAHSTRDFSRFYSKCTDRPVFWSISNLRERWHGKLMCSNGLGLKPACHSV